VNNDFYYYLVLLHLQQRFSLLNMKFHIGMSTVYRHPKKPC